MFNRVSDVIELNVIFSYLLIKHDYHCIFILYLFLNVVHVYVCYDKFSYICFKIKSYDGMHFVLCELNLFQNQIKSYRIGSLDI